MNLIDSTALAAGTPSIIVVDNRGTGIRSLQYNRTEPGADLDELITRTALSDDGRTGTVQDPRLFSAAQGNADQQPNSQIRLSLAGQNLRSDSVDSGFQVALYDAADRLVWAKDARGNVARYDYDTLGRPIAVYEKPGDGAERVAEYIVYGDADPQNTAPEKNNARGRIVRHYDTGGLIVAADFSLAGSAFSHARQLLSGGEQQSDWQGNDESQWRAALDGTVYTTRWTYNTLGNGVSQTDAKGNRQRGEFDVAGILSASYLTLKDGEEQPVLQALTYNAAGRKLSETAGNGMVTQWNYEPETLRLQQLTTTRPADDSGRSTQLQNLSYGYDPVGNILSIANGSAPTRYYAGQRHGTNGGGDLPSLPGDTYHQSG